jgi:hypothetical protein
MLNRRFPQLNCCRLFINIIPKNKPTVNPNLQLQNKNGDCIFTIAIVFIKQTD